VRLPEPEVGQVIRYRYLWNWADSAGREDGSKDRPCAIVIALPAKRPDDERPTVAVVPITHTPPRSTTLALELPTAVKQRLGLDDERSWIILDEVNRFVWPGPDLVPARARHQTSEMIYGSLPQMLMSRALAILGVAIRESKLRIVTRTE
jgi:hypothetical protein